MARGRRTEGRRDQHPAVEFLDIIPEYQGQHDVLPPWGGYSGPQADEMVPVTIDPGEVAGVGTIVPDLTVCGAVSDPLVFMGGATVRCTRRAGHPVAEGHEHEDPSGRAASHVVWYSDPEARDDYAGDVPASTVAILADVSRQVHALVQQHGPVAVAVAYYQATGIDLNNQGEQ